MNNSGLKKGIKSELWAKKKRLRGSTLFTMSKQGINLLFLLQLENQSKKLRRRLITMYIMVSTLLSSLSSLFWLCIRHNFSLIAPHLNLPVGQELFWNCFSGWRIGWICLNLSNLNFPRLGYHPFPLPKCFFYNPKLIFIDITSSYYFLV